MLAVVRLWVLTFQSIYRFSFCTFNSSLILLDIFPWKISTLFVIWFMTWVRFHSVGMITSCFCVGFRKMNQNFILKLGYPTWINLCLPLRILNHSDNKSYCYKRRWVKIWTNYMTDIGNCVWLCAVVYHVYYVVDRFEIAERVKSLMIMIVIIIKKEGRSRPFDSYWFGILCVQRIVWNEWVISS